MNTKSNKYIYLSLILFSCLKINEVNSQINSTRLNILISEVNEIFLTPYAPGILLSPYEILQHNRNRTLKNIEMVETIVYMSQFDTIPILIKNNKTIIHKPDEELNSRTYNYHEDGKISEVLRGRHVDDQFIYDENRYLVQHGHGGELKRATRKGNTFEWHRVKNNELEYITSFDEQNRLLSFKSTGQYMVEYKIENYEWLGNQLVSKNTIKQYKSGTSDTSYMKIEYDTLGITNALLTSDDKSYWSTISLNSKIEKFPLDQIKISILKDKHIMLAITYDKFDNWIEIYRPNKTIQRVINYRKKKRRK